MLVLHCTLVNPTYLDTYFDPTNFFKDLEKVRTSKNTTLTIKYSHGGGLGDNVIGGINSFSDITINLDETNLNSSLVTWTKGY